MCGVMGMISAAKSEDFPRLFQTLAHRGPDAHAVVQVQSGRWSAQFGHHRLSIIDVAAGAQPMQNEDHTIVFNGEIYNFERLRSRLPAQTWRTRSDTEVVLELVRKKGVSALAELDGFFAFGLYDSRNCELILARDRWGIKPLYYAVLPDGGLMFASELHPFLRSRQMRRQVPLDTVLEYLFWDHVPYDHAMLEGVHKLEPGTYLSWRDGELKVATYYDHGELLRAPRTAVTAPDLWELISQSVRDAMIADVPVGVLLSGGLDSSLVAAAAHDLTGQALPSFSIGFEEAEFDESGYARQVAQLWGGEHFERRIGAADMLERWQDIVVGLDEPLADPSLIPTRLLCELAREHVPVVLGGDGGDELFGGYPTYRAQRWRRVLDLIPKALFETLREVTRSRLHLGDGYQPLAWKVKRLIGRYDHEPQSGHFRWMSGTDWPDLAQLAGRPLAPTIRPLADLNAQDLQSFMYLDLRHYLPYSVLAKVDRASMAVGLECRPPLLSNACVERAFRIPAEQKVSASKTKIILREAARPRLPAAIVDRDKRGFAIPLARWLKGALAPEIESMLKNSPLWDGLNVDATRVLWRQFREGSGDHSKTFWSLLVLHKWLEAHGIEVAR